VRDYQKDLEVKPEDMACGWEYDEQKDIYRVEFWSGEVKEFKSPDQEPIRVFSLRDYARTLQSQLQQAQEREAALRQALKYEVMYHGKNCTCRACQALSSPQPSRCREMEKVVETVRLVYSSIPGTGTFKKELIGLYDALTAYDQAHGERCQVSKGRYPSGTIICPNCEGTRILEGCECIRCSGSGYVAIYSDHPTIQGPAND